MHHYYINACAPRCDLSLTSAPHNIPFSSLTPGSYSTLRLTCPPFRLGFFRKRATLAVFEMLPFPYSLFSLPPTSFLWQCSRPHFTGSLITTPYGSWQCALSEHSTPLSLLCVCFTSRSLHPLAVILNHLSYFTYSRPLYSPHALL